MSEQVEPTTPAEEWKAIGRIVTILDKLDPGAQERVVSWVDDRYPVETEVETEAVVP